MLNPGAKTCTTLTGTGSVGLMDGPFEHAQFSEPGGLCVDLEGKLLVVADTNNHVVRVLDLEKREVCVYKVSELRLVSSFIFSL